MPKIDLAKVPVREGSGYPAPFHEKMHGRSRRALGDAGGLTQFGVNLMELQPGNWSSQRHWHTDEDEFIRVMEGEVTLVTDSRPHRSARGRLFCLPEGVKDGHHLINESNAVAVVLEVGTTLEHRRLHLSGHRHVRIERRRTPTATATERPIRSATARGHATGHY